jgi:hypothetical protein
MVAAWCRSLHALAMHHAQPRVTSDPSWPLAVLGSGSISPSSITIPEVRRTFVSSGFFVSEASSSKGAV